MIDITIWKSIGNRSTGYLGERRNEEWKKRDILYGAGNWQMGWMVDDKYLEYPEVCQLYTNAYYEYFKMRPELFEFLLEIASNVYDDAPANVEAGTDFHNRGKTKTHIHDTAIRECVKRFGRNFRGEKLLQVSHASNKHPLSQALSPGQVPFYNPAILSFPDNLKEIQKDSWWLPGSVEDFYQRAKRLCAKQKEKKDKSL